MTFGSICRHPKRTKYDKGPCSGGDKIADWGASKGAGGDMSHPVYILKEALICEHFYEFVITIAL